MDDERRHKAEEARGSTEQRAGEARGDPGKQSEGHFDRGKAQGKQAGERSGDTMHHFKESIRNKARQLRHRNK